MKPFLKWAGNKTQIIGRLRQEFSKLEVAHGPYARLIEPFLGSGAVFLGTDFKSAILADLNDDLINLFTMIQSAGPGFVKEVEELFVPENNDRAVFNAFRTEFNSLQTVTAQDKRRKAALFIYLNRHCFNGLCRYNGSGGFNVPFGKYKKPLFPEASMVAFGTKIQGMNLLTQGFEVTMADASIGRGDLVYCDPPYVPLSLTSSFSDYAKEGFGLAKQKELAQWAETLQLQGATVVVSNHDTPLSRELYVNASRIESFNVQRFISGKGDGRKSAPELLAIYEPGAP